MTGRERLQAALSYAAADRVPTVEVCLPRPWVESATGRTIDDPWLQLHEVAEYLDADGIVMPVGAPSAVECVGLEAVEQPPDSIARSGRAIWGSIPGILCRLGTAITLEDLCRMALREPVRFASLCEAALAGICRDFASLQEAGFEAVVVMDDVAGNQGLLVSPALLRKFVFSLYRQWLGSAEVALPVIFHSDGDVSKIIPDVADAAFAGLHGCEPAAGLMVDELVRAYRCRLVFVGGFCPEALASGGESGGCKAVLATARRCSSLGGYIGGSDGGITDATPPSSLRALHATLHSLPLGRAAG